MIFYFKGTRIIIIKCCKTVWQQTLRDSWWQCAVELWKTVGQFLIKQVFIFETREVHSLMLTQRKKNTYPTRTSTTMCVVGLLMPGPACKQSNYSSIEDMISISGNPPSRSITLRNTRASRHCERL